MKTGKRVFGLIGALCAIVLISAQAYAGDAGVKVGTLKITVIPGSGHNLIIRSSSDIEAVFTDSAGKTEHYIGEMGVKLGVDLTYKTEEQVGYLVFSPAADYKTGSYALEGKYFGTAASASVGAGVSARMLLGGFDKSFTLQPLALGVNKGAGASLGLGYLYLQKAH